MATRPSVIWAYEFENGRALPAGGEVRDALAGDGRFRWLHLNLADQRTRDWIEAADAIPLTLREMLLDAERHQRALVEDGATSAACCTTSNATSTVSTLTAPACFVSRWGRA